jgi:hypothetical protein
MTLIRSTLFGTVALLALSQVAAASELRDAALEMFKIGRAHV